MQINYIINIKEKKRYHGKSIVMPKLENTAFSLSYCIYAHNCYCH